MPQVHPASQWHACKWHARICYRVCKDESRRRRATCCIICCKVKSLSATPDGAVEQFPIAPSGVAAKLKASQLHQTALLETAQRRNDVAAASENIATGVVTLSAKPSHDLRLIAANGAYVDLEKLDLTQDLFLVLCAISGTGIDLELGFIHKLRSMGVSFDARAHHARQVARHLHVSIPTPIELCKMRADELIAVFFYRSVNLKHLAKLRESAIASQEKF